MIPHEKGLVERLQSEKFVLFGINSDEDPESFRSESMKLGVTWPSVFDGSTRGPVATTWGVSGWPTIYIVDHKGVIRFKDLRDKELENAVLKLLAESKGELPYGGPEQYGGAAGSDEDAAPKKQRESVPAIPLIPPAAGKGQ